MSVIDEVKQKIDIVDVVGLYSKLAKSGRNFRAVCPFHQEKTPSFFVFPERQSWHCFGACSTGGDVFSFLMKKEGIEFGEALRRLADRAGVVIPSRIEADGKKEARDRIYEANEAAARYFHEQLLRTPAGETARQYLSGRGLNAESMAAFQLGFARESWDGLKLHLKEMGFAENELIDSGLLSTSEGGRAYDRWRGKIMFPIKDERGRTTGFGARVLESSTDGPKYINTPQTLVFDKSGTLYGLNLAASEIRRLDQTVIVEGYMDVIAAHQYGFRNVIASMGTAITEKQVSTLKRFSKNLVLALDSDAAGAEAMQRCVEHENAIESEIRVVVLPDGKDPDDVIKADTALWSGLVEQAKPVVEYVFEAVSAGLDLNKVAGRAKARDRLYPVVNGITDVVRRAFYLQKLARMLGVTDSSLEAAMRKRGIGSVKQGAKTAGTDAKIKESLFKSATEEYCLTLLLRCPELRVTGQDLTPEYFQNSENREIFVAWRDKNGTLDDIKQAVDITIHDHLSELVNKSIHPTGIEKKYADIVLRLREEFLRNLERKREALLSGDADSTAELARSKEVSAELKQVFQMRARREQGLRS